MDAASHNHAARLREISRLIDDRPSERIFEVDRRIFTDPEIFDAELRHVFEATWNFIGLESQVAKPNDFVTTHIGRHPILVMRSAEGKVGAFLNTCRHRGTIVCPLQAGPAKASCLPLSRLGLRFERAQHLGHGASRRAVSAVVRRTRITIFSRSPDLAPIAASCSRALSADVPPLEDFLGDTRAFLDLIVDQSDSGEVELVPGASTYTFDGNWKLQFENGLDYYHFATTHSSYVDILKKRNATAGPDAGFTAEPEGEQEGQGSFSFDYGHAVNWSIKRTQLYGRPLGMDPARLDAVRQRVGSTRAKWMLRQRNLTIFPNLQVIDILSAQVRTRRPLAPDKTEMVSHCLAPVGESAAARTLRIRNYEDFFNASGLASSDDNVMYEFCQTGYEATTAAPTARLSARRR